MIIVNASRRLLAGLGTTGYDEKSTSLGKLISYLFLD